MKNIIRKYNEQIAGVLGYGKKHKVKEAIHMASRTPPGRMATYRDPIHQTDPAQLNGIELEDEVALASDPLTSIGHLAGMTGFREAIVRLPSGNVVEYHRDSLVKFEDAGEI